jgi:acyl-CoA thioester hydrolase
MTVDLSSRASFDYFYAEKLRFSDTDMIGHINNVAFAALIESGRVNYTRSGMLTALPPEMLIVMRRIELDYRAELHWPAEVDVGCRLLSIGRTSFAIGNAVFHGDLCAATSITTLVAIGRASRRPVAIPDVCRASMEGYIAVR